MCREKFGSLNSQQREILDEVINSALYMREMISSLLYIYKYENGAVRLNKTEADIDKIIRECIKEVSFNAAEHSVSIRYINCISNSILYCDADYIKRIISNMLNNAVYYSYKQTKAVIKLEEDSLFMRISFKSFGIPIKEELKAHIFEKYNSGVSAGTGIGLYFCKTAAEAHGGTIKLNSSGSDIEFNVILPKEQQSGGCLTFE